MKKSELRKLVKEVISEQATVTITAPILTKVSAVNSIMWKLNCPSGYTWATWAQAGHPQEMELYGSIAIGSDGDAGGARMPGCVPESNPPSVPDNIKPISKQRR